MTARTSMSLLRGRLARRGHHAPALCQSVLGGVRAFGVWVVLALTGWLLIPAALGLQPTLIVGGSMAPGLRPGDVVHVDPDLPTRVRPGQVVVFTDASRDGALVTHRVEQALPDGTYRTRGDANDSADSTLVPHSALRGVGRLVVPTLGRPVLWLRSGSWAWMAALAAGAGLLTARRAAGHRRAAAG